MPPLPQLRLLMRWPKRQRGEDVILAAGVHPLEAGVGQPLSNLPELGVCPRRRPP